MTCLHATYVRCHCCGDWLRVWGWDNRKPTYCEGCGIGRSGPGRGQCEWCIEYPTVANKWSDPHPDPQGVNHFFLCIR